MTIDEAISMLEKVKKRLSYREQVQEFEIYDEKGKNKLVGASTGIRDGKEYVVLMFGEFVNLPVTGVRVLKDKE